MPGRNRVPCLFALMVMAFASEVGAGPVKLGAPFGDHMVIQRDRPIFVWGEAGPGQAVAVRVGDRRAEVAAGADGRWEATLDPLPAGGPVAVSAESGADRAEVRDVLVGDVWLCSGQSNMQMTLAECDGGAEVAEGLGRVGRLRLASVGRRAAATPESDGEVRWRAASPDAARRFSGVGAFFAEGLLNDPGLEGVPIGVIDSSFGGSRVEAWVPKGALAGFDPAELRASMFGVAPSGFYNGMIALLGPAPLKGVVWYQGEGNADRPGAYAGLLRALFGSWRARFGSPDLPFVVVGLPDWAAGSDGRSWAWLREAQAAAVREDRHAGLAVGIGTTDGFDLHPRQKREIGRRAALRALRDVYGRPVVASGPVFRQARRDGGAIRVEFDHGGDGLASRGGGPVRGFAVAGADGVYWYADVALDGDAVFVRSDRVPEPATVRYAWSGVPDATLANRSGLPAAPFRTDTLPLPDADGDVRPQPAPRVVAMKGYEVTVAGNGAITGLVAGGKQFLSHEPGNAGRTGIPGWLGPRDLANVRDLGPGRVACSDTEVTLLVECSERVMDWTITNRGKDVVTFRVALAAQVEVGDRDGSGLVVLRRPGVALAVSGADAVTRSEDGSYVEAKVDGGGGSKRLGWRVGGPPSPPR